MSTDLKTGRVMWDRGHRIIAMPSDGLEIGDHVWFGEPRNLEAVVTRMQILDPVEDTVPAPECLVQPEYLPRRGILAGPWVGWPGCEGFTTPLRGEELAERAEAVR